MSALLASERGLQLSVSAFLAFAAKLIVALMCGYVPLSAWAAEDASPATIHGMEMPGFGRIILTFDRLPSVEISQTNGVLVLNLNGLFNIDPSRLGVELPNYVSAARSDPDHRGVRLALFKSVRANLIEAGNSLYVDLLPTGWKGPPPPLPVEIVQALSKKAQLADAAAKAGGLDDRRALMVDTASSNRVSRLLFRGPSKAETQITKKDHGVEVRFEGRWSLDLARLRAELPRGFASVKAETRDGALLITIMTVEGADFDARMDEGAVAVDVVFKGVGSNIRDLDLNSIFTSATLEHPVPARNREADPKTPISRNPINRPSIALSNGLDGPLLRLKGVAKVPMAAFSRINAAWLVLDLPSDPDMPVPLQFEGKDMPEVRFGRSGSLFFIRAEGDGLRLPRIIPTDEGYDVTLKAGPQEARAAISLTPVLAPGGGYTLSAGLAGVTRITELVDPIVGDRIMVAPTELPGMGLDKAYQFPHFEILPSYQGLAIVALADDIEMRPSVDQVVLSRPDGLAISNGMEVEASLSVARTVINRARWERDKSENVYDRLNGLMEGVAAAKLGDQKARHLEVARFLAANALYREAAASFLGTFVDHNEKVNEPRDRLELAIFHGLGGNGLDALQLLSDVRFSGNEEASLWRGFLAANAGRFSEALNALKNVGSILPLYPENIQTTLRLAFVEAAVESGDWGVANDLYSELNASKGAPHPQILAYFKARIDEASGLPEEARKTYDLLVKTAQRDVEVRATLALTSLDLRMGILEPAKALAIYEAMATFWRGDFLEAKLLTASARVALDAGKWRNAFNAVQRLNRLYADTDGVRPLLDEVKLRFDALISGDQPDAIKNFDAVTLFIEFREFMPTGRRADELIRKYIERLAELDLTPQAAELLRYQIDFRLEGAPRATAAVRLASLYLMDRKPIEAIRAIADTRFAGLSDEVRTSRRLLEARARAELGELQTANELLEGLDTPEASIVRGDLNWNAKNWALAGENYEAALGSAWRTDGPPSPAELKIALRAVAAYVLANDGLAKDRFGRRYSVKLSSSPESSVFKLLAAPANVQQPLASAVLSQVSDQGHLDTFLKAYRTHYGLDGVPATSHAAPAPKGKPTG